MHRQQGFSFISQMQLIIHFSIVEGAGVCLYKGEVLPHTPTEQYLPMIRVLSLYLGSASLEFRPKY
jgi:hypothetical protein